MVVGRSVSVRPTISGVASLRDEGQHAACVTDWLAQAATNPSPKVLLRLFEAALGALWTRAAVTLGEVTLTAIAERVLHNAAENFPGLSSLSVEATGGISFQEFRERTSAWQDPDLARAIRFVLVEFLTVLGTLTAEILTPELHAELLRVTLFEGVNGTNGTPDGPTKTTGTERGGNGS
ncbi:MAG: hypothetical protein QOI66_5250 [Myxococcales bacterium]|jgi:hypothetical protein|nr:hypothetical protein [Myxococcales bacterium]